MNCPRFLFPAACCAVFLLLGTTAWSGDVPRLINYQGKLTDSTGVALANGEYSVTFELYDAPADGNLVWGETRTVTLDSGVFNVALGGAGAQPVAGAAVNDIGFAFGASNRFLQTTIVTGPAGAIGQVLAPRQQMTSVPYAISSADGTPTGTVLAYSGTDSPTGYVLCDGAEYSVTNPSMQRLLDLIGNTYGGDPGITFRVPDLRGRVVAGIDGMGGTQAGRLTPTGVGAPVFSGDGLGASVGADRHTLTAGQLAAHAHGPGTYSISGGAHAHRLFAWNTTTSGGFYLLPMSVIGNRRAALNPVELNSHTTTDTHVHPTSEWSGASAVNTPSGQAHPITQPSMLLNYIIKL